MDPAVSLSRIVTDFRLALTWIRRTLRSFEARSASIIDQGFPS